MLEDHGVDTILANPRKTKLIAEAKIKSDKLDARTLATLLQGNLVFESYVPPKAKQEERTLIRHRASLVKTRTEIRNRIHAILAKHELQHDYSDLFGKKGFRMARKPPTRRSRPRRPQNKPSPPQEHWMNRSKP